MESLPSPACVPWTNITVADAGIYQTCNEFGHFRTVGSTESPFWPLSHVLNATYYLRICADAFTSWTVPHAKFAAADELNITVSTVFTNGYYGGKSLGASRVILPDGSNDPWHSLALIEPLSPLQHSLELIPVMIDGASHCGDMYAPEPTDSRELQAAHDTIAEALANWLPLRP
jgi:serine protease 16